MTVRAVILDSDEASPEVAGVSVTARLAWACREAGCDPVVVIPPGQSPPTDARPSLVCASSCLVQAADLRKVISERGRLVTEMGDPLGIWFGSPESGDSLPEVTGGSLAVPVTDPMSARVAERVLWQNLETSDDGFMDRLVNRRIARVIVRFLARTRVTPNQVTGVAAVMGLFAGWLFAQGNTVLASLVFITSAVVDCMDGDLARATLRTSRFGRWFDLVSDQVVHIAIFVGIGIGVSRQGSDVPVLLLTGSAVAGALMAFVVVLRGMLGPPGRQERLKRVVEAMANRDFAYLLLVLSLLDSLEVFLWLAAIGSHVYWMVALWAQRGVRE